MSYKLSRRKLGQLVLAGTVVSGISYLSNKVLAQTPSLKIIGIDSGNIITTDQSIIPEVNTTELDTTELDSTDLNNVLTNIKPVGLGLVLQSLVSGNGQTLTPLASQILAKHGKDLVQSNEALSVFSSLNNGTFLDRIRAFVDPNQILNNLTFLGDAQPTDGVTPLVESNEILTGFTSLSDGTLVVAVTPISTTSIQAAPTHITFLSTPVKTLIISGLNQDQELGSLLGTNDGRLIGLVGKKNGTPPIRLVDINIQTGEISSISKIQFPSDERASNLAQSPDGKLYTSLLGFDGSTTLVQLDSNQKNPIRLAQLKLNGQAWNNGLQSLICSATGQLMAFGAMRYQTPNVVYSVDKNTGNMTWLQDFNATQITVARR